MNNFVFQNPTKLIFGRKSIAKLTKEMAKDTKILITYGGGSIKKNGVYDQVVSALSEFDTVEFGGIEPNPQYDTLMRAVEIVRSQKIDFIVAVGGGSVIDGTKFIAAAANYEGEGWDILLSSGAVIADIVPVPFATVLTLPATGSEMNNGAVISRASDNTKFAFKHALNYPKFSILDPQVCYSLPTKQVANGLADTFCHTLEQYLTYPCDAYVQDRFAEGVLLSIIKVAPKILAERTNYDACANFMYAATMGLNGFLSMGVPQDWATHMIGHELTALHGLDHGVTLAIVGPSLMTVMKREKAAKLLQLGERVFEITQGNPEERITATINAIRSFYESIGIKTRLSDYGIGEENFELIAARFTERGWELGENQSITPQIVIEILKGAL